MKRFTFLLLIAAISSLMFAQNSAHDINEKLGRGVNFGNMFEANPAWSKELKPEYFPLISEWGFNSVRVPIKWSIHAETEAPYTIDPEFMDTIRSVVDLALANDLMVVINMHHYDEIFEDPAGHTERFLAMWDQISLEFKDYPDSLLFEILNEPHKDLDQAAWNALFPIALDTIRKDNPTRVVVIGPPDWNGVGSIDKLAWPENDTNLIVTVHYYSPFHFTHQGASWVDGSDEWLGETWDSTAQQLLAVVNDFGKVRSFASSKNVPVWVGEFGAYSTAEMVHRKQWTAYIARKCEEWGFSWAYWEFAAGFGVYDPGFNVWRNDLLNALTERTDPNSIPPESWELTNPDFLDGKTGWNRYQQGGAACDFSVINEEAVLDITALGTQAYHIQFVQTDVELVQGAEYKLSFEARSEGSEGEFTSYFGEDGGDYTNYSGWYRQSTSGEMTPHSYTFTMQQPTDKKARLVFDLNYVITKTIFDNIYLEVLFMPTLIEQITLGPEPAEINTYQGSLQLSAVIEPEDASNKDLDWELITGINRADISDDGLLTARGTTDGTVKVRASATDGSEVYDEISVTLSNQTTGIVNHEIQEFTAYVLDTRIEYTLSESEYPANIMLYSVSGNLLSKKEVPPYTSKGNIDVSLPESTLYILKLEKSKGESEVLKITR